MVRSSAENKLLELLISIALRVDETVEFRLSSGETTHTYVDCKAAFSYPDVRSLVGRVVCDRIPLDEYGAVGGLELGAYPIATAISDEWYRRAKKVVRAFVIRKRPKEHGLQKLIEGDIQQGQKALIVDDVVTKGNSVLQAIEGARGAGLEVVRAIAIVDRTEPAVRKRIGAATKFEALFSIDELLNANRGNAPKRRTTEADSPGLLR